MKETAKICYQLLSRTIDEFLEDRCPSMAAALAYYTAFSLAPLLVIVIAVLGWVIDPQAVKGEIAKQISAVMGPQVAEQVQALVESVHEHTGQGLVAALLGLIAVLFGATGAFAQLQEALNIAWNVKPDPQKSSFKHFLFKRVLSFSMILGIAFLLLVSLTVSAGLAAFGYLLEHWLYDRISQYTFKAIDLGVSLGMVTLFFAAIFKVLPDARVAWRHVWVGALFTALLFTLGKFLIGFYLGRSSVASAYGAAGSFALVLLWVYYSAIIILLGAQFTQVWAEFRGAAIRPSKGAVRVFTRTETMSDDTRN